MYFLKMLFENWIKSLHMLIQMSSFFIIFLFVLQICLAR